MAKIYPIKGTRTTLSLSISTFLTDDTDIQVTNIEWDGLERAVIETTHLLSTRPDHTNVGGRTYMMGDLDNPGDITIEISFDANKIPPFRPSATTEQEVLTLTFLSGSSTSATWVVTGGLKSFRLTNPLEERCTAVLVWKCSGLLTINAGA